MSDVVTDLPAPAARSTSLPGQVGRAASALVKAQLTLIKAEAKEDSGRVAAGLAFIAVSVVAIGFAALGAHVLAVVALVATVPLPHALALVIGADVVLAALGFALGRARLKKRVLGRARDLAAQAAAELRAA